MDNSFALELRNMFKELEAEYDQDVSQAKRNCSLDELQADLNEIFNELFGLEDYAQEDELPELSTQIPEGDMEEEEFIMMLPSEDEEDETLEDALDTEFNILRKKRNITQNAIDPGATQ